MKIEVHTIRTGSPDWLVLCGHTLDKWVARHGYPLRVWTEQDNRPEYPCLKFCVTQMWKEFAEGDSDWMVYIDGDIYVHPEAPEMSFLADHSGALLPRSPRKTNGRYSWWCRTHLGQAVDVPAHWWNRCMGWFAIDRHAVKALLQIVAPPYNEGTLDECQANYWMSEAVKRFGLNVASPPQVWHRFYWQSGTGWMWHLARTSNKMAKLCRIRHEGKIP